MIDFPREPNPGESLDASWGARVVRALRALFPMPGPGINVSTGPTGTTISAAAAIAACAKSDGCKIGIIQTGASGQTVDHGEEVDEHIMTAYVYPAWPEQTGRYLVRVYTPCVYRRSPLIPGDPVLLHPCSVGVTTEGEDS